VGTFRISFLVFLLFWQSATYKFSPGIVPPFRQMFYHLCDVEEPEVQRLVHLNDGQVNIIFSFYSDIWVILLFTLIHTLGWFKEHL